MDDLLQYYRILEVGPGTSLGEIKRAYRELTKVWHPDRFPDDIRLQNKAQEKFNRYPPLKARLLPSSQH